MRWEFFKRAEMVGGDEIGYIHASVEDPRRVFSDARLQIVNETNTAHVQMLMAVARITSGMAGKEFDTAFEGGCIFSWTVRD